MNETLLLLLLLSLSSSSSSSSSLTGEDYDKNWFHFLGALQVYFIAAAAAADNDAGRMLCVQPVDLACLSSTQQLVTADTSHNCSLNDSALLSTSVVNTTCSADDLLPYQEMFNVSTPLPRTSSMSEGTGRAASHRKKLLAQRASQLAASLSRQ